MSKSQPYRQLTNLQTLISSIVLCTLGILLLFLADYRDWKGALWLQSLSRDIGSLLIASVAIALVWELSSRRAFYAEALSSSRLVDEITTTGLIGASAKWQGSVDWSKLFHAAGSVKIFFAYGRTWRNTYREQIDQFAARPNTKAKIVLPDPDDSVVMRAISQRTGTPAQDLADRVRESTKEFIEIFEKHGAHKLSIWYVPFAPTYSYYCFDEVAIFTLYQHQLERVEVPTFVIEKGGTLYDFFRSEFEIFTDRDCPRGRKIYPPTS